jgi:biotin operon repressor
MNKIEFKKQNIPFTQVANGVLGDKRLTQSARFLYGFMYSKPDGWDFSATRLAKEIGVGRDTILKELKELRDFGYLISQRLPNGRMLYKVIFPPIELEPQSEMSTVGEPQSEKATVGKSHRGKSRLLSNTELIHNKEGDIVISVAIATEGSSILTGTQWNQLIDGFKPVNPMYAKYYKFKVERDALTDIVKAIGFDETLSRINSLSSVCSQPYAPKITKPTELRRDLGKLDLFVKQLKRNSSPALSAGTPYTKGKYDNEVYEEVKNVINKK